MENLLVENLKEKWEPVLNCEGMEPIQDSYRKNVTAILLENQEKALREEASVAPVPTAGGHANSSTNTNGSFDTAHVWSHWIDLCDEVQVHRTGST